eukprot:COSAG04_NODE_491_length_13463_cov_5.877432_2_plen_74_part_00
MLRAVAVASVAAVASGHAGLFIREQAPNVLQFSFFAIGRISPAALLLCLPLTHGLFAPRSLAAQRERPLPGGL